MYIKNKRSFIFKKTTITIATDATLYFSVKLIYFIFFTQLDYLNKSYLVENCKNKKGKKKTND